MVRLNARTLEVLCMIYHYKHYRRAMANLYPEQNINWYEDTKAFYFGLNLPEGLEEIGNYAFHGTSSLSEIIIPESVKTIGEFAFDEWSSKQTIKCKATEAGENWNEYWNYEWDAFQGGYIKSSCNIIWGYQDNNT